uniref:TORC_N domain-containing protein n=1 Tax=Parastrongyloides trichosuri TaxID=131310 RepID=A0A0N4ZNJ5_PARTI
MGTPTPRKFSEKIALMERKQNEDQELFHSIMRDVKAITSSNSTSNPTTPLPSTQSSQPTTNFVFQNNNQGYSNINNIHQQNSNNISSYQGIPINSNTLQLQNNVWNGVGGSLPNVHDPFFHQNQTIPQNTLNAFYINPNNNYNQSITYSQIRSRSPGAPNHYHPYSNGINPLRGRSQCERQNTFDGGETSFPSISNQLAPPDMHHWKARSDSAINVHPHSNYFSDMMNNHHLGGNLPNYEQFHNIYHPNNLMNNGNLIEDSINPNNIPYNCQTSTTSSRQQSPIPQTNYCNNFPIENCNTSPINSPQYPPTTTYSTVSSPVCYTPSLGSPNSVSQDSPTNNTFPQHTNLSCIQQQSTSTEYSCQQQTTSTIHGNSILQNHVQSPINNPICIPTSQIQMINMTQQQQQQSSCQQSQTSINPQNHMMINQNGSHLPCQQQQSPIVTYPPSYPQTLIGPYSNIPQESSFQQSSPESPSTSIICDNNKSSTSPRGNNTYPKKKFSNSPDPMDIPNIVLTGADGELDSFQNLNLSNENFDFTSTNPNTLINCGGMMRNGGEIIITTGGETTSSYHNITNNPSMRDLQSSIIITRDFIN